MSDMTNLTAYIVLALIITGGLGFAGGYLLTSGSLGTKLENVIQDVSSLETEISNINERIVNLENKVSIINIHVNDLNSNITNVNVVLIDLKEQLKMMSENISDVQYMIETAENMELIDIIMQLNDLTYRMDSAEAYRILKRNLVKPGQYIIDSIVDDIIFEMRESPRPIDRLAANVGEFVLKPIIKNVINAKTPSQIWYSHSINKINSERYETYVVTYYNAIEFSIPGAGDVAFAYIEVIIKGLVNINTNVVEPDSIQVYSTRLEF